MTQTVWWHLKTRLKIRWWVFNFIKVQNFFISCYSHSTVLIFIAKDAWICISTTLWIFKTKPWQKLFDDIWRHVWWSVDECTILCKEQEFFHFVLQSILCFRFYCRTRSKSVFLKRYQSLKLNHDTDCLMTSEDTVEDPLMSVHFYIKIQNCFISCDSHSTVFILLQKTLESVFLPRYESLKLNHDIWRHGWRCVDECSIFYKEQDFFSLRVTVHLLFSFSLQKSLNLYFYHAVNL